MTHDRITQLEESIAHLSLQLEDLNDVVTRQDGELAKLTHRVKILLAREAEREMSNSGGVVIGDERPPHY